MNSLKFDYEVAEEVGKRLETMLGGLPEENARAAVEEFLDDYCSATFGVSIIAAMREVKLAGKEPRVTTQTIAKGRGVLISRYGFNVKSDTPCKCGRAFVILDEMTREDAMKQDELRG